MNLRFCTDGQELAGLPKENSALALRSHDVKRLVTYDCRKHEGRLILVDKTGTEVEVTPRKEIDPYTTKDIKVAGHSLSL